jgi:hypothetical protein
VFFERLPEFIGAHPILSMGFVAVTLALVMNELSRFTQGFKAVSPAQLTQLINRENALVVDVSAQGDFEKGHIVGSKQVGFSQFDPENKLLAPREGPAGGGGLPQRHAILAGGQAPGEGRLHQGLPARRRHRCLAGRGAATGQGPVERSLLRSPTAPQSQGTAGQARRYGARMTAPRRLISPHAARMG